MSLLHMRFDSFILFCLTGYLRSNCQKEKFERCIVEGEGQGRFLYQNYI
jgi:hypothetical protein